MGMSNYSTSVDIWSVGCIFAELLLRIPIFKGNQELEVINKILK
jgi:serine/threonine protein kinase